MKKLILFLMALIFVVHPQPKFWYEEFPNAYSCAVDLNGIDESMKDSSISFYDNPNLVLNPRFESKTGSPNIWSGVTFDNWTKFGNDTLYSTVNLSSGAFGFYNDTVSARVRSSLQQDITVEPNALYVLGFYSKVNIASYWSGRYSIYDNTHSSYIVSSTACGITTTDWGYLYKEFTVPDGCTSIKLTLGYDGEGDYTHQIYYDNVSISKPFDFSVVFWAKRSGYSGVERQYPICRLWTNGDAAVATNNYTWAFQYADNLVGSWADSGKIYFNVFKSRFDQMAVLSTTRAVKDEWMFIAGTYDFGANGNTVLKIYINGILENTSASYTGAQVYSIAPLTIGKTAATNAGSMHHFYGQIGEVQIVKYSDITASTFDAKYAYDISRHNRHIPTWTGGDASIVSWYWFDNDKTFDMLKDHSGNGNNLTGENIDITNQSRWRR